MAFTYGMKKSYFNNSYMIEHVVLTGVTQWFLQTFWGKMAPRTISLEFKMYCCSCWTCRRFKFDLAPRVINFMWELHLPHGSVLGPLSSQTLHCCWRGYSCDKKRGKMHSSTHLQPISLLAVKISILLLLKCVV